MKHPNDMTRDELRKVVGDMAFLALDLAQHLDFTTHLKLELQENAYKRAVAMAYELAAHPYCGEELPLGKCEIAVFGADGLRVKRG